MMTVGDHNRQAYIVVRQTESGMVLEEHDEYNEALESVKADDDKCFLVRIEYDGGGIYRVTSEDWT